MKKSDEPIKNVAITFTVPLHEAIKNYAEKKKWSVSFCVREAIKMYLKEVNRRR